LLEGDTVTGDPDGPFATNVFKTGTMSNETDVVPLLTLGADKSLVYVKP
jgi:hypothetical protein